MKKYRAFLISAFVLVATIVGIGFLACSPQNKDPFTKATSNSQPFTSASPASKTSAGVVVTLEEFGDYQCPPCGALHPTLKKLKQEFGPNLNFVFRNLPLTTIHKNALFAAQAAEAARVQNHFWEMHDLLYENQDLWKDDINPKTIFLKFAGDLRLDTPRFARDMEDNQVKMRIEADEDAAAQLGITGTPTIVIEGRELRAEAATPEGIRKGIELMMTRKAASNP